VRPELVLVVTYIPAVTLRFCEDDRCESSHCVQPGHIEAIRVVFTSTGARSLLWLNAVSGSAHDLVTAVKITDTLHVPLKRC
jgi:hypothetical protein